MSYTEDNASSINKSSKSSTTIEAEESTLLKTSGYNSASDSQNCSKNSTNENQDENTMPKDHKKRMATKGKIVSSRYRQAALSATSRMRNNSNSQQSILQMDATLRTSDTRCNSPLRVAARSGLSTSCVDFQKDGKVSSPTINCPKKMDLAKTWERRATCLHSPNMHSTAVNATFLDTTRGYAKTFSTSVVKAPPKRNAHAGIPDISVIQPFNAAKSVPTLPKICHPQQDTDDEYCDVTQADLDLEYLRYLTWAHVDTSSEEAFQYQCVDAEKQISFMMQIMKEKREKVIEHKKRLMLTKLHKQVCQQHQQLKEVLGKLAEVSPNCEKAVEEIGRSLEPKINQIKLKNIYIPEDEEKYKDGLKNALSENNDILKKIEVNLGPRKDELQTTNETVNHLQRKIDTISTCKKNADRLAGSAIQEASLTLTINDLGK